MTNADIDRAHRMTGEYIALEEGREGLDERNARLRDEIESNERKAKEMSDRQERIADELGPAIRKRGPVYFGTDVGRRYAIASEYGASLLTVTELAPVFSLDLAPRFSEAEIREAALHAAAENFVVMEDDGEIEDWGDDDVVGLSTEDARFASRLRNLNGREPLISNGVTVRDQAAS